MSVPSTRIEGALDPGISALANAVKGDWLTIDAIWEPIRRRINSHLRRDTSLDPQRFLADALNIAHGNNLLPVFATELIKHDLTRPVFRRRLRAVLGPAAFEFQAFQSGVFTPMDALLAAKGLLRACEYVCRVDVDGDHKGTGVLVRPALVATAAHVVWDLLEKDSDGTPVVDAAGSLQPVAGSIGSLTLTFGYAYDYLPDSTGTRRNEGEVAPLHPNWLAWGSGPSLNEYPDLHDVRDIEGIDPARGPWDLVLIRLATPRLLPEQTLRANAPPSRPFHVNVLHHPTGATDQALPLLWSIGRLDRQLGKPPVRCLHDANTLGGSSGAPVFDRNWRIVALHQGGQRVFERPADALKKAHTDRNRAVPIRHWRIQLDEIERSFQEDLVLVRELRGIPGLIPDPYPVIGRRETQERLWRAMQAAAPPEDRLLIVRGQPGMGLRFTKLLVRELVTRRGCLVAALDMVNALDDDAAGFATRVAGSLSGGSVDPSDTGLTTAQRRIRTDVAPNLGRELNRLAQGRVTFVILEGFDQAWLDDPPVVRDLLDNLIQQLGDVPTLRLVLVGWLEEPPDGFAGSVEDLSFPTGEDVAEYFTPEGEDPNPDLVAMAATLLEAESPGGPVSYASAHKIVQNLSLVYRRKIADGSATPHDGGQG